MSRFEWSDWKPFPHPFEKGIIVAPFGFGVYQLRNIKTDEYIYCGRGDHVAYRMTSLLPSPQGQGTRNNYELRQYILDNISDIIYRTILCSSRGESQTIERMVKEYKKHKFHT